MRFALSADTHSSCVQLAATQSYNYTVTDKSMLDGLPPSVLAAASANAGGSATADNGPWVFRFDGQTADYVLSYASNATVRKAIFEATHNVAADGGAYDNTQLVQQILKLRQQKATALGYSSFGAYKFATMVSGVQSSPMGMLCQ